MAKKFGNTWWGRSWLEALSARAAMDANRLSRGRTYARKDTVTDLQIEPGLLTASVQGNELYSASLGVATLTTGEWDILLERVVTEARLAALLLSGEVPEQLADVLLPTDRELMPSCSCPDVVELCKHSAALCYEAAELFDQDPFLLFLLRGRGRAKLLADIRQLRAKKLGIEDQQEPSNKPRGNDHGLNASEAYRLWSDEQVPTIPKIPIPPADGASGRLTWRVPADSGIDQAELAELLADAADRASAMLAGHGDSCLNLSEEVDIARRAARGDIASLAATLGQPVDRVWVLAHAYSVAGVAGVAVIDCRWKPAPELLEPARLALKQSYPDAKVVVRANTVSVGGLQLRLDLDANWWRFEASDEHGWLLASPASSEPFELL